MVLEKQKSHLIITGGLVTVLKPMEKGYRVVYSTISLKKRKHGTGVNREASRQIPEIVSNSIEMKN